MKMSHWVLCLLWLIASQNAFAQTDSVLFVSAKWSETKITKGVVWKSAHFDSSLFQSDQSINILSINYKKCSCGFEVGYEKEKLKTTSTFGKEAKAIAALNGTFFNREKGGSVDYIRSKNVVIHDNVFGKPNSRSVHQKAAMVINRGALSIEKWNGDDEWEEKLIGEDVMISGPLLMYHKQLQAFDSSSFTFTRHPRTAVAITKSRVFLITVDGRNKNASGMSLSELAKIVKWLGSTDAINLDGGGSTTLWIFNQPENGVVNYPSDNGLWDHFGERVVANVLLLRRR